MSEYSRIREFVEEEDAKADDLEAEFDNIAAVLGGEISDDNLESPMRGVYRTIAGGRSGMIISGAAAGTRTLGPSGLGTSVFNPGLIDFDASDFEAAESTQKLLLRARLQADGVFVVTLSLRPVTAISLSTSLGASLTLGSAVSGSSVELKRASSGVDTAALEFTAPGDGLYVIAAVTAGTAAANGLITATLLSHNV